MAPMIGMMISATSDATIAPKAAPMITPTARSTTLPRSANFLNSSNIVGLPNGSVHTSTQCELFGFGLQEFQWININHQAPPPHHPTVHVLASLTSKPESR